jgi:hypothetical protein
MITSCLTNILFFTVILINAIAINLTLVMERPFFCVLKDKRLTKKDLTLQTPHLNV